MTPASRTTGAITALLVFLGIGLFGQMGWLAALVLALIAPAGLGLGDVKFSAVIGGLLGWFGWHHVAMGTVLGFTINGVVALVVLLVVRGGRRMQIPFGPSMVLGAVCALALLR